MRESGAPRAPPFQVGRLTSHAMKRLELETGGAAPVECLPHGRLRSDQKVHAGIASARFGLTNRTEVALFAQRHAMGARGSAVAADPDVPV